MERSFPWICLFAVIFLVNIGPTIEQANSPRQPQPRSPVAAEGARPFSPNQKPRSMRQFSPPAAELPPNPPPVRLHTRQQPPFPQQFPQLLPPAPQQFFQPQQMPQPSAVLRGPPPRFAPTPLQPQQQQRRPPPSGGPRPRRPLPPGQRPPSKAVIDSLNTSRDFLAVARRLRLRQLFAARRRTQRGGGGGQPQLLQRLDGVAA